MKNRSQISDILDIIEGFIRRNKFDEAAEFASQLRNDVYIPTEYLERYENAIKLIKSGIENNKLEKDLAKRSKNNLLTHLVDGDRLDINKVLYLFDKYTNEITVDDAKYFNKVLGDETISNYSKVLLANELISIKYNANLKFYNNHMKRLWEFNPTTIESHYYDILTDLLKQKTMRKPYIYEGIKQIVDSIRAYFFPSHPDYDSYDLAIKIIEYINCAYRHKKSPSPFYEFITNILHGVD